jgi:hypothetical protein
MTQEERTAATARMAESIKATAHTFLPKLKEVLTADQFTRLEQIHWQSIGIAALSDPDVVKTIPLSNDQQDKIRSINAEYAAKRAELTSGGGNRLETLAFAKMQEQNKEREAKITDVLTKDQQDKFALLKGKEFDLSQLGEFREIVVGGRGGPGGAGVGPVGRAGGGDRIGGFGNANRIGIVGIAGNVAVQKELGLSAEAAGKVKVLSEEVNTAIREATTVLMGNVGPFGNLTQEERAAVTAKIAERRRATVDAYSTRLKDVLTADQFTRLQQIHWQSIGTAALSDPDVIKAIPLSKDQQDKIQSINTEYAAKRADMSTGSGGNRIEPLAFAKMQMQNQEQDRERDAKITDVLTKDQQDKLASLKGKEFDLSQMRGFGGAPVRQGGGSGGNGSSSRRNQPGSE